MKELNRYVLKRDSQVRFYNQIRNKNDTNLPSHKSRNKRCANAPPPMVNYVTERTATHPINATSAWEGPPVRRVLLPCHRKDKPKSAKQKQNSKPYQGRDKTSRLSLTSSQDQNTPPPCNCTLPDPSRRQSNIGLFFSKKRAAYTEKK